VNDWVVVPSAGHVREEVANIDMIVNLPLLRTVLRTRSPVLLSLRGVRLLSRWIVLAILCPLEVRCGDLYWHPHSNQWIDQIRVSLYVHRSLPISLVRAHIGRFGFTCAPLYDLDCVGYDSNCVTIKVRPTKFTNHPKQSRIIQRVQLDLNGSQERNKPHQI
jgi:hypothetical protein